MQMISEYFPARGRPINRVEKPSSFVECEHARDERPYWRSELRVRLHEVVTIETLGTSAITHHAMLCAVDSFSTVKRFIPLCKDIELLTVFC